MSAKRRACLFAVAVALPLSAVCGTWWPGRAGSVLAGAARGGSGQTAAPRVSCRAQGARDQDDMCIWVHPTDPAKSTIITSDKAAGRLFVYDLAGRPVQSVATARPGNIDLRYGFALGGRDVDLVALNQRGRDYKIRVYAVDPASRRLRQVDNDRIETGANYGGCLYRSPKTGKLYFVTTSLRAEQYELFDDGAGRVSARKVRDWKIGYSEGAVGDDEAGKIYIAEEDRGLWEVGGEPTDPAPGKLVLRVGEHGLTSDVEGVTIYHEPGQAGYLIVSSQGSNCFKVYRRGGTHAYLGTFAVRGARDTDGIDVTNVALGRTFPKGLFACHTDAAGRPVLLTPWEKIAATFAPPLATDTAWQPRKAPPR